jgi:hypothetical protein
MFFTTLKDITIIIKEIESAYSLKYFQDELSDEKYFSSFNSAFDIPNLGYTEHGDWNLSQSYFVIPKSEVLSIREIPQRKGGIKYAVDENVNKNNIEFKPCGIYTGKENIIVAGRIATISETEFSQQLYKDFATKIKKNFSKIEEFYVGKEAEQKLRSGWRLVTNEKLAMGFDLKIIE